MTVVVERAMKRPRGRPKTSDRDDVTVKIDRALASKVKLVAAHRGISVAELLSELAHAPIDNAYSLMIKELEESA